MGARDGAEDRSEDGVKSMLEEEREEFQRRLDMAAVVGERKEQELLVRQIQTIFRLRVAIVFCVFVIIFEALTIVGIMGLLP